MRARAFTRRATVGMVVGTAAAVQAKAMGFSPKGETTMERVDGIGGFFFRAKDPKALARWYEENLGILPVPTSYGLPAWRTEAGTTVVAPFPKDTSHFGDPNQQWMINFRVRNLDKMAAQLRGNGIAVEVDPELYPNGRFAQLKDVEGNPIQLWQPGGKDPG